MYVESLCLFSSITPPPSLTEISVHHIIMSVR